MIERPLLAADAFEFRKDFDERPFAFAHALAGDPSFDFERLVRVATEIGADPNDVYYDAGDVGIGQRWNAVPLCEMPIDALLERIQTANAWVVLRRAEKFPEFRRLLDACIAEIEAYVGRDLRSVMKLRNAIIFINSPHRVSSYHIDRECSLLLQIRGRKTVHVFDRNDREVLPEAEIERFWAIDNNAPRYRAEFDGRASVFELGPGDGVHIPVNAPHYVRNGAEVSVSLNINFHYRDALLADVYRMNYWLRRCGFSPLPPKHCAPVDSVKRTLYGSGKALYRTARRLRA